MTNQVQSQSEAAPAATAAVAGDDQTPEQQMAAFVSEAFDVNGVKVEKPAAKPAKESAKKAAAADDSDDESDDKDGDDPAKEAADEEDEEPESDDTTAESEQDEADKESDRPKKKDLSAKERVQQAVRRQRAAEHSRDQERGELSRLRAENEALRRGDAAPQKKSLTPPSDAPISGDAPKSSDYQFGELDSKYIADTVKFETKKALAAAKAEETATRQQDADRQEAEQFVQASDAVMEKGTEKYGDDFIEKVIDGAAADEWKLTKTIAQLAVKSDVGHEIFYLLASNPNAAAKVAKLSTVEQGVWFGRQEARFATPKKSSEKTPVQPPKVPAPPLNRPRGANGKFAVGADTDDFAAFEAKAKLEGHFS